MKDFLRQQLSKLHLIGIRQVDYLSKEDVEILLSELEKITKKFSYIPEPRQQAEIEKQLIEDLDAKDGLTLRNVWKWMYKISPLYWNATRISEEDLTPKGPILEGEQRDYYLNKWRESLTQMQDNFSQAGKGSGSRLRESMGQDKALSVGVVKNWEVGEICKVCNGEGGFMSGGDPPDSEACSGCNGAGQINIVTIPATSEAEARKQYNELFGESSPKQ